MTAVYSILLQLEDTSSTNEKIAILSQHKDNPELKEFFRLALNDTCFYIKQIPKYGINTTSDITLFDAMNSLKNLSMRHYTGAAGIQFLSQVLSALSPSHADCITRIIKKDPNCGVAASTVNKVWKGLIKETPYMRCEKPSEIGRIKYPALAQTKSDGMFANVIIDNDVVVKSRNGKHIDLMGIFENKIASILIRGYVYHGELLVMRNGRILDRKTGNGILNKIIKGTGTVQDAEGVVFVVWDMVPISEWEAGKCTQTNINRFNKLKDLIHNHPSFLLSSSWVVSIIEHDIVNNREEAEQFYQARLEEGQEGAVIKNFDGIWEDKTSKDCVKMKPVNDCELYCYDVLPHSKDPNLIGALCFKTSDDKLYVNVGSGMNPRLRAMPKEYFVGKVWVVYYCEAITSKNKDEYSLFLPRFTDEVRLDKTADTLERILA